MSQLTERRKFREDVPLPPEPVPGQMGDGFGHLVFNAQANLYYARVAGRIEVVYCDTIPADNDILVELGRDILLGSERPGRFRVLGTRTGSPGGSQVQIQAGYAPASRYQRDAEGGGQDPLWVQQNQIMPLMTGALSGMTVQLFPGIAYSATDPLYIAYQTISLTAHIPAGADTAALVLLTLNASGTLTATKGAEFTISTLTSTDDLLSYCPDAPAGSIYVSSAVRVYYGQTEVQEGRTNTDIIDLRTTLSTRLLGQTFVLKAGDTMTGSLTLPAESFVGPSSTTGVYFKSGKIGFGTTTPDFRLAMFGTTADDTSFGGTCVTDTNTSSQFALRRARGTPGAETALPNNHLLGLFSFRGHDGSAFTGTKAGISVLATENWSTTANGCVMRFSTTPNGSVTLTEGARLTGDGNFLIGSTTIAARLAAAGAASGVTAILRANATTPGDILQAQNSSGSVLASISALGTVKSSGQKRAVVTKTADYTAAVNDDVIVCNKTTAMTITLPAATGSGQAYAIANINTGVVTIDASGAETINGETTQTVDQWACAQIVDYAAGAWVII
jgi:hypothetical protein